MPPRLARILALLVAVALVGGAFVARDALTDDDDQGGSSGSGSSGDGGRGDDGYRVLCDADLGEACAALGDVDGVGEVTVMTGGEVLAAHANGAVPYDAWFTLDPMPEVLDAVRTFDGVDPVAGDDGSVPAASSGLDLLTSSSGGVDCPDGAWPCVVDAAAEIEVGVPDVDTSAGTLVLAAAAGGLVGTTDFARDALERDELRERLAALLDSADAEPLDDQATTYVTQRGRYRGIVTTHGLAQRRVDAGAALGLRATPLVPGTTIGVVLAPLGGRGTEAVAALEDDVTGQTVRTALGGAGWEGGPGASRGLPDPDVIYAFKEELG